jgi:hypothetical protein
VPFFIRILENSARLAVLCIAGLALGVASAAQARIETLRWLHSAPPEVSGFRVYVGSAPNTYTQVVPAGLPPLNSDGTRSYALQVADEATVYVAVSAYNSAGESDLSGEQMRAPASSGACTPLDCDDSNACTTDSCDPVLGCQNTAISCNDGDVCTADSCDPVLGCQNTAISCDDEGVVWNADFESSANGQHVPGWVDTGAGNSMVEDDSQFSVTTLSGNQVFATGSSARNIHSHYVADGSAGWSWYEFDGRMRVSDLAAGIGVTLHSDYTNSDRYYRLRRYSGSSFHFRAHRGSYPNDPENCVGTTDSGVVPRANTWYRFRFQALPEDGAARVRAKVWEDGSAEPAAWQIDCLDSSSDQFQAGTIGVWATRTGIKYWDDLEVITVPGGMVPGGSGDTLGRPGQPQIVLP